MEVILSEAKDPVELQTIFGHVCAPLFNATGF